MTGDPSHPEERPHWRAQSLRVTPTQAEHHLLPVGLSSSPALTTDPAGEAAILCPAFLTSPSPLPLAATAAGALGSGEEVGCSGGSAGSGALALLSSRQLSSGRCVSSRLFVTLLIFSVCAGPGRGWGGGDQSATR